MHEEMPFWKIKRLDEMSQEEWESLCDGCGRCCLIKLEDADTEEILHTRLACRLLDIGTCRCKDYLNRREKVHDCVELTPSGAADLPWLPETCAYRMIANGQDLAWWHHLVSGSRDTIHEAGISVRSVAISERKVRNANYWKFIVRKK